MDSQLNNNNPQSADDQTAALNKCISIFKSAKTDNERFAALLLVTRLVHSNYIDSAQRKLLYDAIGFTFINRLLKAKDVPENNVYQSLAIAILACFATNEELLLHPQMVAKVGLLNEIISNPSDNESIVDDSYQILQHFSSNVEGCKVLCQKGTATGLCNVIMSESVRATLAWQILFNTASLASSSMWIASPKALIDLVVFCAEKLRTLHDTSKFTYCTNLLSLLSFADAEAFRNALRYLDDGNQFVSDLSAGLGDILQGKVTSLQRDPAIVLVSVMVDVLDEGSKLSFLTNCNPATQKADFFTLIATTVCIEIKMILDESTIEEMIQKATLLTACYNILESVISFLITITEETQGTQTYKPSEQVVTTIYSQITESMMSVLGFLQQESVKYEENMISSQEENDLVLASARVLLAWLAEESMALQKEVNKVLPFLIQLARDTFPTNQNEDEENSLSSPSNKNRNVEMIRLMLPALCHFSSDEKSRKILTENAFIDTLVKYYRVLWKRREKDGATDSKTALITLLGVFLNFAVTEENLAKTDNCFKELLGHLVANTSKIANSTENFVLLANMVVLGLMLIRYLKHNAELSTLNFVAFFTSIVVFLKEADKLCKAESEKQDSIWSSVSELWFLGVQVLTQELKEHNGLVFRGIPSDVLSELFNLSTAAIQSQQ